MRSIFNRGSDLIPSVDIGTSCLAGWHSKLSSSLVVGLYFPSLTRSQFLAAALPIPHVSLGELKGPSDDTNDKSPSRRNYYAH